METIKERIERYISFKGISRLKFENESELTPNSLSNCKNAPNGNALAKIIKNNPELSPDWLLLGQGKMLRSNDSTEKTPDVEVVESEQEKPQKRYTDDMSVQERLEIYIRSKGLGNYQFEMKVGLSQGYIKRVRNCLHPEKIKRIANAFPDLNIEWMIIGRGEMIKQNNQLYENELYKLAQEKSLMQEDIISSLRMELREEKNKRIALEKDNKRLVKNLHDMSEMYAEQISSTLADIRAQLTA